MRLLPSPNAKKPRPAVSKKSVRKLPFKNQNSTTKKAPEKRAATKMTAKKKFDFEKEFRVWDYFFVVSTVFKTT